MKMEREWKKRVGGKRNEVRKTEKRERKAYGRR